MADHYSRRAIVVFGFGVYSLATACMGAANSALTLGVARFIQGGGEATGNAPANTLISDMVTPDQRRTAYAIWRTLSNFIFVAILPLTGYLAYHHGWRAAFAAMVIPSVFLSGFYMLVVKDPPRYDGAPKGGRPSLSIGLVRDSIAIVRESRSFLLVLLGCGFVSAAYYSNLSWDATFLMRLRDLNALEVATLNASARLPGALIGGLGGGLLADFLIRRDDRWRFWFPAMIPLLLTPVEIVYLFFDAPTIWLPFFFIKQIINMAIFTSIVILAMETAGAGRRTTGLALLSLFGSLFGDLVGPTLIGVMNDTILLPLGKEALRYSLLFTACFSVIGSTLIFSARGAYKRERDLAAAAAEDSGS